MWKKSTTFLLKKIKIAVFTHVIIQQVNYNNIKEADMNPKIEMADGGCKLCGSCAACMFCGLTVVAGAGVVGFVGLN